MRLGFTPLLTAAILSGPGEPGAAPSGRLTDSGSEPVSRVELVAPSRVRPGQHLPFVVRLRKADGSIHPFEQTPIQMSFGATRPDSTIAIKRGAGTGVVRIDAASDFVLSAANAVVPAARRAVEVSTRPIESHAGTLPGGDVVWDASADHLVEGDITVPAGTRLILAPGAWVMVNRFVNFSVHGEVIAEGTSTDPVVITSRSWSEPWGGMEFIGGSASFRYCMVVNGGGDLSKGKGWHTDHQHIFFGEANSVFEFDQCFFLNSPGKVFGATDARVTVTNSVSSFVWHGGEFVKTVLLYRDNHVMNIPNDDGLFVHDIDTDGLHIDFVSTRYPEYSVVDRCFFVTGKDDAIDHTGARLRISSCWLEDWVHEGVAASFADTVWIFDTVAIGNDQGFEAGYTVIGHTGPFVFIDHCVAVNNNVGVRIGDGYNWDGWTYDDRVQVTNSVLYGNGRNIWNHVFLFDAPLAGALDISHTMTNDSAFDGRAGNVSGVPEFDPGFHLIEGSFGSGLGTSGTAMGRIDSTELIAATVVVSDEETSGTDARFVAQNYPNPFGSTTNIAFSLPEAGVVQVLVYNVLGQKVASVRDDRVRPPGRHRIELGRRGLTAGVYFYRLQFRGLSGDQRRHSGKFAIAR